MTLPKVNVNETAPSVQNAGDEDDLRVVLGSSRRCDAFSSTSVAQARRHQRRCEPSQRFSSWRLCKKMLNTKLPRNVTDSQGRREWELTAK